MDKKEYALYQGEELLEIGTAEELSEIFNVKIETIKFYNTDSYKSRLKQDHKAKYAILLDD